MSRKFATSAADAEMTLSRYLARRLPAGEEEAERLVRAGSVYVDRRRVEQPDRRLGPGQRIVVHSAPEPAPSPPPLVIAYEDQDVVVLDKPPGMPSQATRQSARGAADRLVRARYPGARPLHRLDREASGLMLFTRRAESRRRFQRYLDDGRLLRRYRAVVWGALSEDRGALDRPIGPDPRDRRRQVAGAGRHARTEFVVLRRGRSAGGHPCTFVELTLATGRTHQIRVHLADAGHPVCGDPLYNPGPEPEPVGRLALVSTELSWPGTRVEASSPMNTPALANVLT